MKANAPALPVLVRGATQGSTSSPMKKDFSKVEAGKTAIQSYKIQSENMLRGPINKKVVPLPIL